MEEVAVTAVLTADPRVVAKVADALEMVEAMGRASWVAVSMVETRAEEIWVVAHLEVVKKA